MGTCLIRLFRSGAETEDKAMKVLSLATWIPCCFFCPFLSYLPTTRI